MNTINFIAAAAIGQNNKQRYNVARLHSANACEPKVEQQASGAEPTQLQRIKEIAAQRTRAAGADC
jgi:hypothetical protein